MPSFYRKRVKNPCGRCNYPCEIDYINCSVCNKCLHRKCLKMTKRVFQLLDRDIFVCSKKCEFAKFPFHAVSDKEFIKINARKSKFPCLKCAGECHKKFDRLQCAGCLRWLHLECSPLGENEYGKYISSNSGNIYTCSTKCELKMLPFCCLDEYGFTKYVSHAKKHYTAQYQSKRARQSKIKCLQKESENAPSSLCEYLEPQLVSDVVNEDCLNDLTLYHSNVCSLRKNLDKLFETFQDGLKLPDLIGVTETRLDEHLTGIDIDNYDFEPCFSNTQAGGVGIYVTNYLEYAVRRDLSLNLPHCEDILG